MNERDSEIMGQVLGKTYTPTDEVSLADVVVVNTCSIREKAEQKAYSLLGRLKRFKAAKPSMVIAVTGCVAQQEGEKLRSRMPYIDLVVGPQNIYRLSELITGVSEKKKPFVATDLSAKFTIPPFLPSLETGPPHKRFVTIMQGCNNFCTYCVVPHTRGREISRDSNDILNEVRHLADSGVKEITLLGQNVNSYGRNKKHNGHSRFAELLQAVAAIDGIERIRFTTSHPKDLSEELMQCFSAIEKLCSHFHLPVQSGSNRILKRMNRKYSVESYLEKVDNLRRFRPGIVLTTDIIAGFPGESEEDFEQTMKLLETVRFHGAFSFKYSDRPHAKSCDFADKVSEDDKSRRLARLQSRQEEIVLERNREYIGQRLEVMVEGQSKAAEGQLSGRAGTNHIVNFSGAPQLFPGQTVTVKIEEACSHSLRGTYCPE